MRMIVIGLVAFGWLSASTCDAGFVLGITSDAPDLNAIAVGQAVQFNVTISGFGEVGNPPDLSNLNVDVAFSSALFGTPTLLTPGSIVPQPADTFTAVTGAGIAGAIFDNIFIPPPGPVISSNGVFFSFVVTALSSGSGLVQFSPPASGFDGSNAPIDIDSADSLSFQIGAVPEPSSFVLGCIGIAGLACCRGLQCGHHRNRAAKAGRLPHASQSKCDQGRS